MPQDETVQRILSKAAGKGAFSSFMQQLLEGVEGLVKGMPKVSGASGQKVMAQSMKEALEEALREKKQVPAPSRLPCAACLALLRWRSSRPRLLREPGT